LSPAFSSPRAALGFGLTLAFVIALPALVGETGCLRRRDVYPAISWTYGPFPWIQQKIFSEKSDVDIAFAGSSHIWNGIDTPYVQRALSAQLGQRAEVFTIAWPWPGFDALYFIAKDLLDHRRVRVLVINDEGGSDNEIPQQHASRWFRMGENSEALAGLSFTSQAKLYGGAVLGMPRQLLSMVRPNIVDDPLLARDTYWDNYYQAPNIAANLGSLRARISYGVSKDFTPFHPRSLAEPTDVMNYSPGKPGPFRFTGPRTLAYNLHFAQKLARLCAERGTHLVVLQMPYFPDRRQKAILVRENWPRVLGAPAEIVGVSPAKLFEGLSDANVQKFFFEDWHLNENGQEFFTPVIAPALLEIYASTKGR
jgi:hypothetical protein